MPAYDAQLLYGIVRSVALLGVGLRLSLGFLPSSRVPQVQAPIVLRLVTFLLLTLFSLVLLFILVVLLFILVAVLLHHLFLH